MKEKIMIQSYFGWILGSPGTGKSTTAFAFLTLQLDDTEWIFTWMYFESAKVMCVRFSNNQKKHYVFEYLDLKGVQDYLDGDPDGKKHFLFLDGYVSTGLVSRDIRHIANKCEIWLLDDREMHRLCILCSMPYRVKHNLDNDRRKKVKEHTVSSWILDEYHHAFAQKQVLDCFGQYLDAGIVGLCPTDTEQLVLSKFYFAGGCTRYMFSYDTAEVIKEVRSAIRSCHDIVPYVTGTVGDQSVAVINRLICIFVERGDSVVQSLVSRFVASEISLKQGRDIVKRIAETLCAYMNPVVERFLFEMWFFALIAREELHLQHGRTFTAVGVIDVDPTASVDVPALDQAWYKPLKWNQGVYDAVHVNYSEGSVTFFQLTISQKISLKLEFFASLIDNLGFRPRSVEILFLVPDEVASNFQISPVTGVGLLSGYVTSKNENWIKGNEKKMAQICTFVETWKKEK